MSKGRDFLQDKEMEVCTMKNKLHLLSSYAEGQLSVKEMPLLIEELVPLLYFLTLGFQSSSNCFSVPDFHIHDPWNKTLEGVFRGDLNLLTGPFLLL